MLNAPLGGYHATDLSGALLRDTLRSMLARAVCGLLQVDLDTQLDLDLNQPQEMLGRLNRRFQPGCVSGLPVNSK